MLGRSLFLFVVLIGLLPTNAPCAEPTAPAENKLDPQELVIGDWYEVTVEKDGEKKQLHGTLIKTTDEWIVLGLLLCGGRDVPRMPMFEDVLDLCDCDMLLEDIPGIGSLLMKREAYYSKAYFWIPKKIAEIDSRTPITNKKIKNGFQGDSPKLESPIDVYRIDGKETPAILDASVTVQDEQICIINMQCEIEDVGNPTWSQVPILGYLFVKERVVERKIETKIPLDEVLYVSQHVPYDYWKNRGGEQKQTVK